MIMNGTLMHVLYKEVWIIEVCGAAEECTVSLHHNLVLSLLLGFVLVQQSNQPVQKTALTPKQRTINIQFNQLPDWDGCRAQQAELVPAQEGENASL